MQIRCHGETSHDFGGEKQAVWKGRVNVVTLVQKIRSKPATTAGVRVLFSAHNRTLELSEVT